MKIQMILACKAAMFIALPTGILVSCNSKKSDGSLTNEKTLSEVVAEPKAEATGMPLEEFNRQFLDILSQKDLMQSALTNKVDKLCWNLNLRLLEQMLELAAADPPDRVGPSNWRLGYNQFMVFASNRLGASSAPLFYKLASNNTASSVMRDYASQHYLRTETQTLLSLRDGGDNKIQDHLQLVLMQANSLVVDSGKGAGSMPGTTLLGLAALAMPLEQQPQMLAMVKQQIAKLVMPVLRDFNNHDIYMRSAAIQTASRLQVEEAGPIILEVATNKRTQLADRIAAIGSLRNYPSLLSEKAILQIPSNDEKVELAKQSLIRHCEK